METSGRYIEGDILKKMSGNIFWRSVYGGGSLRWRGWMSGIFNGAYVEERSNRERKEHTSLQGERVRNVLREGPRRKIGAECPRGNE